MPKFFTRTGDDGTTDLLGEGRVPKDHPRPQAYGALDEATAALGVARAAAGSQENARDLLQAQRDLYRIMSEVAAHPNQVERYRSVDEGRVAWLESCIQRLSEQVPMPKGFVVSGDSPAGAAIDLARTIVRRAERLVVGLMVQDELDNPHLLTYLNRLSSLCFVMALHEDQLAGVDSPSMAKGDPSP